MARTKQTRRVPIGGSPAKRARPSKVPGLVGYVVVAEGRDVTGTWTYKLFKSLQAAWDDAVHRAMKIESGEYDKDEILEHMEAKPTDADFVVAGGAIRVYPTDDDYNPYDTGDSLMIVPVVE